MSPEYVQKHTKQGHVLGNQDSSYVWEHSDWRGTLGGILGS